MHLLSPLNISKLQCTCPSEGVAQINKDLEFYIYAETYMDPYKLEHRPQSVLGRDISAPRSTGSFCQSEVLPEGPPDGGLAPSCLRTDPEHQFAAKNKI